MNMGARESIYQKSGVRNFYKMSPHHHEAVKEIWETIEKNPTTFANGFFISLCDKHPEFIKYFSKGSRLPLNIDARMTAKFTLIWETLGYIILDCYDKPKQLDKLTGYSAMVHKDMRLNLHDFLNFAYHIVEYLVTMFFVEMTLECQEELKKYFSSISQDIVSKIEDFHRYEVLGLDEPAEFMSCSPCSPCIRKLIFGHPLLYWKDRKKRWENRVSGWVNEQSTEQTLMSSTEDEESTAYKSRTEDELSEWTVQRAMSFDRQGLRRRTQMLTTDTDGIKTDGTSYSDLFIVSLTQEPGRQVGNLKKPGSQHEKVYVAKHVTVKTDMNIDITAQNSDELRKKVTSNSYSPRQRFRSRSTSNRTSEIPKTEVPKAQGVQQISAGRNPEVNQINNRVTTSARQRRRMNSLNR